MSITPNFFMTDLHTYHIIYVFRFLSLSLLYFPIMSNAQRLATIQPLNSHTGSVQGLRSPSATGSRAPSVAASVSSYNFNSADQEGNGTRQMEKIFTMVLNGKSGPTLGDKTFREAHRSALHAQSQPHRSQAQTARNPPTSHCYHHPRPDGPDVPPFQPINRKQADFEAAQFALKQAK
jgi:hypothetical protein